MNIELQPANLQDLEEHLKMNLFRLRGLTLLMPALALLASCASKAPAQMPANATQCHDPRPQICTMDYTPVCATRDTATRCVTPPCASTETATYSNGCGACADAAVFYFVPDACDE